MKQLKKNIRQVGICLCALFVLLAGYGAYNMIVNGNRWFSSSVNTFARQQKKNVIAGDVLDRGGVLLATTVEGKRECAADEATRKAVVHVVGDSDANVNNGVESFMVPTFMALIWALARGFPAFSGATAAWAIRCN